MSSEKKNAGRKSKDVFSERICLLREEKGLSRQKVADDLGMTRAALEYYEKGLRTPNINIIREISDYYGVSIDFLFGKIDTAAYSMDIKFISEYTGLSEKNALMLAELKQYNLIINSAIEGVLNGISDHFNRK